MTIEEIKALAPKAEVYELDPEAEYIVVLRRNSCPQSLVKPLGDAMKHALGHGPIILRVTDMDDIRLLEIKK